MKILKLHLMAFGPFTDIQLDLSGGSEGFHLIHGPNEAGKSSALRALHQLLYGIPVRSTDAFIHPFQKMRIGGTLRRGDGTILEFIRRKGNTNTLRMADEKRVLDESRLDAFLSGIGPDAFSTMFGIDHVGLRKGGDEIIQGEGEVGQLLFSAGAGISDLRKVQSDIQSRMEALFLPAGKNPRINQALRELGTTRRLIREIALSSEQWEHHHEALEKAVGEKTALEKEISQKQAQFNRLKRTRNALPEISLLSELESEMAMLKNAVSLSPDFPERRKDLSTRQQLARAEEKNARKNLADLEKEITTLSVPEDLLAGGNAIEALYQELGSFRKGIKEREQSLLEKAHLQEDTRELLLLMGKDLRPEDARALFPNRRETARIRELIKNFDRLSERRENTRRELDKLVLKVETRQKALEKIPEVSERQKLARAVETAAKAGDIEKLHQEVSEEVRTGQEVLALLQKELGLGGHELARLADLPVPASEAIESRQQGWSDSLARVSRFRDELETLRRTILEVEGEIRQLQKQSVPSMEALSDARELRSQGWELVRRVWKEGQKPGNAETEFIGRFSPVSDLGRAYEQSVENADNLADRLRSEADRAARKESLSRDLETKRRLLCQIEKDLEKADTEFTELEKEWAARWEPCGIDPAPPSEMRHWRLKYDDLLRRRTEQNARVGKRRDLEKRMNTLERKLLKGLAEAGQSPPEDNLSLAALSDRCRERLEDLNRIASDRKQHAADLELLGQERAEAEARLKAVETDLCKWRELWEKAVAPLRLPPDADPSEAAAMLEDMAAVSEKLKKTETLDRKIEAIETDSRRFKNSLKSLAEQAAPGLLGVSEQQAAGELNTRLTHAREKKARRESLVKSMDKEQNRLEKANLELERIEAGLMALQKEAHVSSADQLEEAERKSEKRRRLENDLKAVRERLRKQSGGAALEDFIHEVQTADPDRIEPELEILSREIENLEGQKSTLHEIIGTERNELSKMDGSARAAELSEDMQSILGALETDVQKYVRLRIGREILSQTIENYREKHQGPVLRRSGELFSRMTLGSFESLRVEVDDKGQSLLMGVRPGGRELVDVNGMSDGSRDQLYLALRLASLENYMDENEPMPFILDDILINFDNHRAAATLKVLSDLSEKTQIIFFTHHQHLVDLATENIPSKSRIIHDLPRT